MENKITVKYKDAVIQEISPNTPSFSELKQFILKKKDEINLDYLVCSCDKKDFDIKTFSDVLKETIQDELSKLNLDFEKYQEAINAYKNQK